MILDAHRPRCTTTAPRSPFGMAIVCPSALNAPRALELFKTSLNRQTTSPRPVDFESCYGWGLIVLGNHLKSNGATATTRKSPKCQHSEVTPSRLTWQETLC